MPVLSAEGVSKEIDGTVLLAPTTLIVRRRGHDLARVFLNHVAGIRLAGDDGAEFSLAEHLLHLRSIGHLDERFPHELSSGQSQLFQLALVLFRPSQVLLLDEPEQRLDTDKRVIVADLLAARRDRGDTLVLACHDPLMTDALADQVIDLEG